MASLQIARRNGEITYQDAIVSEAAELAAELQRDDPTLTDDAATAIAVGMLDELEHYAIDYDQAAIAVWADLTTYGLQWDRRAMYMAALGIRADE